MIKRTSIHKSSKNIVNSNTAKNGYKEEQLVCNDLNFNTCMQSELYTFIPERIRYCSKLKGTSKVDITSEDKRFTAQVKKYKHGQFQQLDRHWLHDLIQHIPAISLYEKLLRNWCELPLSVDGKFVDKSASRVLLSNIYYQDKVLHSFVDTLNRHKRDILEYAFYGTKKDCIPEYLIGVEYKKNTRFKLIAYKISDIIDSLCKYAFEIAASKSVIKLGTCLSLQRKGGDGGKKSSNQLQFKIILSSLQIDNYFEFIY